MNEKNQILKDIPALTSQLETISVLASKLDTIEGDINKLH